MKFLFLEPFFGGSHMDFAKGLISHSRHEIELYTLPARFWKWRMRGAALFFAEKIEDLQNYDGLITSGLLSLSDFRALTGSSCPPALVYFHENQLTYPLAPGEKKDFHFGFTDITTALTADRVLFNSRTHLDSFFSSIPNFLNRMPDYRPKWVVDEIYSKTDVLYPGCQFPAEDTISLSSYKKDSPPLIIWNHRWEFDKGPKAFFQTLDHLVEAGLDFSLALLGENYQNMPKEFIAAKERYGDRIVRYGYEKSKEEYIKWLKRGSIVVSTANQENFGISVVEAVRFGCLPILPDRLSYPEIIPEKYHYNVLYGNSKELIQKLSLVLTQYSRFRKMAEELSLAMRNYAWEKIIDQYDEELERLAEVDRNV